MIHDAPCSVLIAREPKLGGEFPSSILVGAEWLIIAATGGKNIDLEAISELSSPFVSDPGRPVETLVELSQEADLLVVGSRGLHGPAALGSVSERVGHRAACSVLVVR
jgi:nucleotide-binding universal stress UspA family protein